MAHYAVAMMGKRIKYYDIKAKTPEELAEIDAEKEAEVAQDAEWKAARYALDADFDFLAVL